MVLSIEVLHVFHIDYCIKLHASIPSQYLCNLSSPPRYLFNSILIHWPDLGPLLFLWYLFNTFFDQLSHLDICSIHRAIIPHLLCLQYLVDTYLDLSRIVSQYLFTLSSCEDYKYLRQFTIHFKLSL